MNQRIEKFLQYLLDEEWHIFEKLPKGIGAATIDLCIARGFVRTKRVDIKREGDLESYRIALHITGQGKTALLFSQIT